MEHPPLVAGQTVRFAVHLTRLADFQALERRPAIDRDVTPESRRRRRSSLPGSEPLRPGAFRVEGKLPPAGRYRWALRRRRARAVRSPRSRHDDGVRRRGAPRSPTPRSSPEKDPTAIAYLKEQQWTNPFATALVREGEVRTSIRVPAVDRAGHRRRGASWPRRPMDATRRRACRRSAIACRAGQELGRLEPRLSGGGEDRASLDAAVAEAQATLDAREGRTGAGGAAAGRTRRSRPARRRGAARRGDRRGAADGRQARLAQRDEMLRSGGGAASGNAFVLRAPIAGRVAEVFAALGASYDEGAPLFRIVRGPIASSCRRRCRPATRPRARDVTAIALRDARPRGSDRAQARSRARRRRDRSEDARAAAADRGGRTATGSCWSARPARPSSTRASTQRDAGRAARRPC